MHHDDDGQKQTDARAHAPYETALLRSHVVSEFPSATSIQVLVDEAAQDPDGHKRIVEATNELKGRLEFGIARKILEAAHLSFPEDTKIVQQLALCTYKDEELHAITRYRLALGYLEGIGLGDLSQGDHETQALGGAICKRKWEYGGQIEDLYQALAHYRAAYEKDRKSDMGYGAVNAAYILDILASRALLASHRAGLASQEAMELQAEAQALRNGVVDDLTALIGTVNPYSPSNELYDRTDWFALTLAEAHFGLGQFAEVAKWMSTARDLGLKEWERETTVRQLVNIARLRRIEMPADLKDPQSWHPAWQAIHALLDDEAAAALSCYRGNAGLALSGGGFRASFFHIGVLARLAEIDALRHIDVLSTVSGGSIVGAHYYLEVQQLLRTKPDDDINRQDFIDIVARLEQRFFAGVERNIRMRVLCSPAAIWQLFGNRRSRTHRLGELYERELYARIADEPEIRAPRHMHDLIVKPAGQWSKESFRPKLSNWRRMAKVPILLLNAASLNSGHNWRFTASWMGEPPTPYSGEIDKNERYRRLYYHQAPRQEYQEFRLGYAVAASSCVPGLFEPIAMPELYPDGRVVQLVDGGVHDNQGIHGLLDEGCRLIICSDASGQMPDERKPSSSVLGAPLRSNSILMDRVREAEFDDLQARIDSGALQGLLFLHLTKDLNCPPVDWIGTDDPTTAVAPQTTTPYGIPAEMQGLLAQMRTDLDSFTEVEAYSLMYSGYMMAKKSISDLQAQHEAEGWPGTWGNFDVGEPTWPQWRFLQLGDVLPGGTHYSPDRWKDLVSQLSVARSVLFKVWKRSFPLKLILVGLGLSLLALLVFTIHLCWNTEVVGPIGPFTTGQLIAVVAVAIAGLIWPALKWLNPEKATRNWLLKLLLAASAMIIGAVHVEVFDRIYMHLGRLKRLREL